MRSAFRRYLTKKRIRNVLQATWRRCYNVPGTFCKLREEDVTTYQEHLESYLKKNLQCIRNILQVTWRRCFNVAGTSCMLLEEDLTTYQERLACYLKKLFKSIRERLASYLKTMLQRIRSIWQVTWRRCCNVRLASYFKKSLLDKECLLFVVISRYQIGLVKHGWMFSYIYINIIYICVCTVHVMSGWWFGTFLFFHILGIVTPTPPPPHWYLIMKEQCLCLQDSKKDDEVAVPVCAQEHERYYPAPPPDRYDSLVL